ncbi:MAG: hypothetical protein HC912_10880, partial [Saprospiraceae bacterium]|nr:hypothetical protein [Saprospiraceae bacterium]
MQLLFFSLADKCAILFGEARHFSEYFLPSIQMTRYILFFCVLLVAKSVSAQIFVSNSGIDNAACGAAGSPCATIQFAIDKAAAGDVIEVQAGTYAGFNITKSLTINGANRDVAGYDYASRGAESIINSPTTISSGVNNVNINGLRLEINT